MDIVQLPFGRDPEMAERIAIRRGLVPVAPKLLLRLMDSELTAGRFCATCAAPIESGVVWRREDAYCSVECSLGGNRPA